MQLFTATSFLYRVQQRPRSSAPSGGKFFDVWPQGSVCQKWLREPIPLSVFAEVVVIHDALAWFHLTPPVRGIYYDPKRKQFGFAVQQAQVAQGVQINRALEKRMSKAVDSLRLGRHPYETLPGVDSLLLELRGRRNLGMLQDRAVFLDIDPKCWTSHPLLRRRIQGLETYLKNISRTQKEWATIAIF